MSFVLAYLRLLLLDEFQHLVQQVVVLGAGVCEDIQVGGRQADLQSYLDGLDGHLWAVSTAVYEGLLERLLEHLRV